LDFGIPAHPILITFSYRSNKEFEKNIVNLSFFRQNDKKSKNPRNDFLKINRIKDKTQKMCKI
jgi:hypothetical protein